MAKSRYTENRSFLKDAIRRQVDFSRTAQSRRLPPPPLQKPCPPEAERVELPDGRESLRRLGRMPLAEAIAQRESVRDYAPSPFSLEELSALLWATQGVRQELGARAALRTVPSAGARHAFETYLAVARVASLPPGLYRYLPFDGQLARLTVDEQVGQKAAFACLGQRFLEAAAVTFFWTVLPARMEWRYDLAAHRVLLIDAGHVGQNLYLTAESLGAGVCTIAAYDQDACDQLLGVDGDEEFTIYAAGVGKR